jgi:hypothetical protein
MKIAMNWDMSRPIRKGQRFTFCWGGLSNYTKGYAIATENFKKVNLNTQEAKDLDTHKGIHYYGEAIAHYK